MKAQVQAISHIGLRRDKNEDYIFTGLRCLRDGEAQHEIEVASETPLFFAVADGLGGAPAGEVASVMAIEIFREGISRLDGKEGPLNVEALFLELTNRTQKTLQDFGRRYPRFYGLGTTLTGVLAFRLGWYWVHIGDTRMYRFQDNTLAQVSRDHTLRELSGDERIPPHIVANCFGGGYEEVYCDTGEVASIQAQRDALLLTSDGLHDHVADQRLQAILREQPENPVPLLLKAGLDAGGVDNISCIYIRILE